MKRETGYSRHANDDVIALLGEYKKSGIDCLEITPVAEDYDLKIIAREAAKAGLRINSYHLPYMPFQMFDISATDEEKRVFTVNYQKNMIKNAADADIGLCVIHPSGKPIADDERPARMAAAKKSLAELAAFAASVGSVIAVEDLPQTCLGRNSGEIAELIAADDRLRVCFDTNHLLREPSSDFIRRVGDKIVTTHVSDYDFIDERHWLPGEGKIDWVALFDQLDEIGYAGPILYEIKDMKQPGIIERYRDVTAADVKANHLCLENRIKPVSLVMENP